MFTKEERCQSSIGRVARASRREGQQSQLSETGKQIAARTCRRTGILLGDQDTFLLSYLNSTWFRLLDCFQLSFVIL